MRYQGLNRKDKFTTQQAVHEAEFGQLSSQLEMERAQHVIETHGMGARAMVQETRIKELTAEKLACQQKREQLTTVVRDCKQVVKEKEKKVWKYTQRVGDKAADSEMVRADTDATRDLVKELKKKANALEREKEMAERK